MTYDIYKLRTASHMLIALAHLDPVVNSQQSITCSVLTASAHADLQTTQYAAQLQERCKMCPGKLPAV